MSIRLVLLLLQFIVYSADESYSIIRFSLTCVVVRPVLPRDLEGLEQSLVEGLKGCHIQGAQRSMHPRRFTSPFAWKRFGPRG